MVEMFTLLPVIKTTFPLVSTDFLETNSLRISVEIHESHKSRAKAPANVTNDHRFRIFVRIIETENIDTNRKLNELNDSISRYGLTYSHLQFN